MYIYIYIRICKYVKCWRKITTKETASSFMLRNHRAKKQIQLKKNKLNLYFDYTPSGLYGLVI